MSPHCSSDNSDIPCLCTAESPCLEPSSYRHTTFLASSSVERLFSKFTFSITPPCPVLSFGICRPYLHTLLELLAPLSFSLFCSIFHTLGGLLTMDWAIGRWQTLSTNYQVTMLRVYCLPLHKNKLSKYLLNEWNAPFIKIWIIYWITPPHTHTHHSSKSKWKQLLRPWVNP